MERKETINNAQSLLDTAGYDDLDKIRECLADLIRVYAIEEMAASDGEQKYNIQRPMIYIETKRMKKEGKSKMSDKDIENFAKKEALDGNDYLVRKSNAKIIQKFMDQLSDLKIHLMHANKISV